MNMVMKLVAEMPAYIYIIGVLVEIPLAVIGVLFIRHVRHQN